MKNIVLPTMLLISLIVSGQKIDNMVSFRNIDTNNYFRLNFDNDFFTSSDKDYTGGYNFELASPQLRKNPINHLFFKVHGSDMKYGICLEQIVFTPDCLDSDEIQYGDRPYATAIMVKSFAIATNTSNKSRFISSFNLGWLGPGACGKQLQYNLHQATGNTLPQGWCHQIENDVVLNYEVSYEYPILDYGPLSVETNTTLRIGTLFTNASLGLNITFGLVNTHKFHNNGIRLYLFSQPIADAIGYDATLQGGIFNRNSSYTIDDSEIKRYTFQHNYGIILQTQNLYFEYSLTNITREFDSGESSKWGSFKFGMKI